MKKKEGWRNAVLRIRAINYRKRCVNAARLMGPLQYSYLLEFIVSSDSYLVDLFYRKLNERHKKKSQKR